jgi:hypothetical protein
MQLKVDPTKGKKATSVISSLSYQMAFLPFVGPTFNCISRVLSKCNIGSVGLMPRKVTSFLCPAKGDLGLKTLGTYNIS